MGAQLAAIDVLHAQPYFKTLEHAELELLARQMIERVFHKDELVFVEGEACLGLYIVREGTIKIYKLSSEGREQILTSVQAGGSFGEVAVFDGGPNPANAMALQSVTVWIVPRAAIIDLIQRRPDVAFAIIQNLGARMRHLVSLVEDLALRHVTSRLAKLLLEMASDPAYLAHPLTQQDMAARVGTVREMIGRSLRQLEMRHLIRIEHGKVVIVNSRELEKLV